MKKYEGRGGREMRYEEREENGGKGRERDEA